MADKIKILAISGSTRSSSSNLNLINAITKLAADQFEVSVFDGLTGLPHFNPDIDHEVVAEPVASFRKQIRAADGVLICTPEYAIGVPGTLKNAIDWTVSSMEFSRKPVALITAALSGVKAHESLLGTLLIIESNMTSETQLVISGVKTKVSGDGEITDVHTLESVKKLIASMTAMVNGNAPVELLVAPVLY
ncbi:NADPH-dependent FMN reductase [Pedobacter cryoconitis]|uniref:NAD(P)H-dependent FMN reductase n=1 Tax=Pedobacter cryoconitis TaxID=188932 RepID=A0A7X0J296_9SPHI|nr:NADPH-dependent FMN reductase [Pedobacter cryoconitis]MBB6498326.1 NAD(P)H-dependent FMN reductase [Pedobacter cryoconitis]